MAAEKPKKTCYYELLGLDRKCEAAEIKANYRKLALQMHPDKAHVHGLSVEEATKRFQQIQEAYSVLSDAQERAWYDAHREQILRGDDEQCEDPFKTRINLYKYFSASCFEGFGDGPKGFFAVYTELFEAIQSEEADWEDADEEYTAMPPFGKSDSEWADVGAFYRRWLDFVSVKTFGHADKWNPKDAENRQVKRAMEQENKKARQAAKKEFNAEVRQLVRFVQKRDPRVAAHQREQAKATAEKSQREMQQKKANEAAKKQQRQEAARKAEEERWAEAAAIKAARGEVESEEESEEEVEYYRCEPCNKNFKSLKAYETHCKSKKHLQIVARWERELEKEMEKELEEKEDESEAETEAPPAKEEKPKDWEIPTDKVREWRGKVGEPQPKEGAKEESSQEDSDSDEDAFIARFAANKGPAAKSTAKRKEESEEEEEEEEEESSEEEQKTVQTGGKKAQKREKQRELLKEKQAEKARVQEMVNGVRKAAKGKAAAEGEGEEENGEERQEEAAEAAKKKEPEVKMYRNTVDGMEFTSKTKLHAHIRATGHAALKPAPAPGSSGRKKR